MAVPAHNLYLRNSQVYDETGDPIYGLLEARAIFKTQTEDVYRLQKGSVKDIVGFNIEVTLTITGQNAALKYFIIDQIVQGKTPIIPMLIGEQWDKELDRKERVRLTNIRFTPEELELFAAKAEGNDKSQYEIKGETNDKPDYLDRFPDYEEN
ncbi:hypothetical protein [Aneurinibacillus thermoaerophilus]|uniref:hypothetical protein n=1 Tax=Aneurinibacillus thermoaerophilus TaxID=143495 RepID=UPI002E1B8AFC|nr:hypothetical protein [Aneurinibacillus thermoaerophilus]